MDPLKRLQERVAMDLRYLDRLREVAAGALTEELAEVYEMAEESDDRLDDYAEEFYEVKALQKLAAELQIVGLYRVVELNTKSALTWVLSEKEVAKCYRVEYLHQLLKERLDTPVDALPGYAAVDELRLVNNAIKHTGRVSTILAKRYRAHWAAGQPLGDLGSTYGRLRPEASTYLTALATGLAQCAA